MKGITKMENLMERGHSLFQTAEGMKANLKMGKNERRQKLPRTQWRAATINHVHHEAQLGQGLELPQGTVAHHAAKKAYSYLGARVDVLYHRVLLRWIKIRRQYQGAVECVVAIRRLDCEPLWHAQGWQLRVIVPRQLRDDFPIDLTQGPTAE